MTRKAENSTNFEPTKNEDNTWAGGGIKLNESHKMENLLKKGEKPE